MNKYFVPMALFAMFVADPACAQFSGSNKPRFGSGSFANSPSPAAVISASEGARINRVRAAAGADQNRPVKICDTDFAVGAQDGNDTRLTTRRDGTYVGNIEVYSGGLCTRRNGRRR